MPHATTADEKVSHEELADAIKLAQQEYRALRAARRVNLQNGVSVGAFGFRLTICVRSVSLPRILLHVLGLALRKGVAWMKSVP